MKVVRFQKVDSSEDEDSDENFDLEAMFVDRIAEIKLNKSHILTVYTIGKIIGFGSFGDIRLVVHR